MSEDIATTFTPLAKHEYQEGEGAKNSNSTYLVYHGKNSVEKTFRSFVVMNSEKKKGCMPFLSLLHGVGIHTTNSPRRRSESGENCTGNNYGRHSKSQRVFRRAILWSLGVSSECENCYDKQEEEAKTAGNLIGAPFRLIVSSARSYAARKKGLTVISRPHIHWIRFSGMEGGRSRIGSIQRFI